MSIKEKFLLSLVEELYIEHLQDHVMNTLDEVKSALKDRYGKYIDGHYTEEELDITIEEVFCNEE